VLAAPGDRGVDAEGCLSVVMPCYNEAATVKVVVERVLESPYVAEVIAVDDGSSDGTLDILRGIHDPRLKVCVQPMNLGKGAALRRGFSEATAPYVSVQDADLEYDPADYDQMLQPLLGGVADVVYGSRFLGGRPHRVLYYWHSVGNGFLTTLSNMFTNLNLTDMETCYKAFRREVIQGVELHEDRFGFEPEITAKVARAGWRIYEVGISYAGRTYAEGKKIGWRDGVRALYGIVRYSGVGDRVGRRPSRDVAGAGGDEHALLDSLRGAGNYADWVYELVAPYLGRDVVEVGAGSGELTERIARGGARVLATDVSETCVAELRTRFRSEPAVGVQRADLADVPDGSQFDSVVAVNVIEHLDDDATAIAHLGTLLRPGGRLVLLVPAFDTLYGVVDARIGHRRRYRKSSLAPIVDRAGLRVVDARYVNALGALGWWLLARQVGRVPSGEQAVRALDRYAVPLARRLEEGRDARFGQSLLLVAERPDGE
jgi:2-polyprenyl-3-methyl-5-hydroxy-6-metoxy-1,4-benzoquinol methylase